MSLDHSKVFLYPGSRSQVRRGRRTLPHHATDQPRESKTPDDCIKIVTFAVPFGGFLPVWHVAFTYFICATDLQVRFQLGWSKSLVPSQGDKTRPNQVTADGQLMHSFLKELNYCQVSSWKGDSILGESHRHSISRSSALLWYCYRTWQLRSKNCCIG